MLQINPLVTSILLSNLTPLKKKRMENSGTKTNIASKELKKEDVGFFKNEKSRK